MSEQNDNNTTGPNDEIGHETGPPSARIRRTPWRGWIWSVPLAAIILVAYLVVRTWLLAGPTITITFPKAAGITSAGTPLQYKGVEVGKVQNVALTKDRQGVRVTVSVHSSVSEFLRKGTTFWVVQPSLLSGDVAELISGPYITMRPGKGKKHYHFKGLLQPPPTPPDRPGTSITLYAHNTGGLHYGSPVLYHGLQAGEVLSLDYDQKRDDVRIHVFVDQPYAQHLAQGVRFWRASGLNLSTGSSGVSFKLPPLEQLLKGAISFGPVQSAGQPPAAAATDRHLYADAAAARNALTGPHLQFAARFPGNTSGISPGSPVVLHGIRVGTVRSVSLEYDPRRKAMVTPVRLDLYPERFGIGHGKANGHSAAFEHVLKTLISQGMRAQVTSASLVLGSKQVSLVMAGNPGQASLDTAAKPPRIPAVEATDIASVINQIDRLASNVNGKLNELPIQQIGHHVLKLTQRAQKLVDSPQLEQSIRHLNKALANLQSVTGEAKGQLKPTLRSLRQVAQATQATANTINQVMGGSMANQENVQELVTELTRASRAVRILANYLQRHPEALIRGRSSQ